MKLLFLLLFPVLLSAQSKTQPARDKGEVFKHRPEKPYENIKNTGLVVVTKGTYGLQYEDRHLSAEAKRKVEAFFAKKYNGYTALKTYRLNIRQTRKGWEIEGKLIQ